MAEILGIVITHYQPRMGQPETYADLLRNVAKSPLVPEKMQDPKNLPAPMPEEYAHAKMVPHEHQERMAEDFRTIRNAIDAFGPDAVIIFGDDQYENFREDCVPPFCIYLYDQMESRPFMGGGAFGTRQNPWGEPADTCFVHRGEKQLAKPLATELIERNFPISYAFKNSHYAEKHGPTMLTHAFLNGLIYLDWDRRGFE